MLKGLFLWLVRGAAIIVFILSVIAAIMDASNRITAIIVAIISFIIAKYAGKEKVQAKADNISTCKQCGKRMNGANYTYSYYLNKAQKAPISGLYKVPVDVNLTCPHCGKVKFLPEYVEVVNVSRESVNSAIKTQMNNYLN